MSEWRQLNLGRNFKFSAKKKKSIEKIREMLFCLGGLQQGEEINKHNEVSHCLL